ncbi:hypothetical protein [Burkholderia cepacia]|uniref:hypothetical protein n=1 Tax=Burkholderia cepacia TaxID=292 RepID=UPI001C94B8D5|nr:hypothetical protein [Burkholderia cepacia]MBY4801316.1 hypothetical protein [Burkholderia cepacia]
MISSAAMPVSATPHRRNVRAGPVVTGERRAWRGSGGMEDVKLEVTRQVLFALLNIDFDYCHSGRTTGIFSGFPILALDDTAF